MQTFQTTLSEVSYSWLSKGFPYFVHTPTQANGDQRTEVHIFMDE